MPPRLSTWKAKHRECQAAVDDVKAHHLAKIEELEAENAALRSALADVIDAHTPDDALAVAQALLARQAVR
jgi:hypothetical protein